MKAIIAFVLSISLLSCKLSKKPESKEPAVKSNVGNSELRKTIDSLAHFKPLSLTIDSAVRSDVDELIPVGYNDNGSFAYFINENSGGASQVAFHISPVYQLFSVHSSF